MDAFATHPIEVDQERLCRLTLLLWGAAARPFAVDLAVLSQW